MRLSGVQLAMAQRRASPERFARTRGYRRLHVFIQSLDYGWLRWYAKLVMLGFGRSFSGLQLGVRGIDGSPKIALEQCY